jgi:hypothetical protein
MKDQMDYINDLRHIRSMMERSSRFISLSGLSGVLAGCYALVGAWVAYGMVYVPHSALTYRQVYIDERAVIVKLAVVALVVLCLAVATGYLLARRKAAAKGVELWGDGSRNFLKSLLIPLIAGGIFILILTSRGSYGIVAPSFLIFYGLALIQASHYTFTDIRYLGYLEVALGLVCALLPGYGLIFWAIGFGVLHIVYGLTMYLKYER